MTEWSLKTLLQSLHDEIEAKLGIARGSFGHGGTKGDASEAVWLELLQGYLPERYRAAGAHVVDSKGAFSHQIDIVIFDRQYSPFIFNFKDQFIVPAESVYAVFETKQAINAQHVAYAADKVASVRALHRTSLPIPHAGGIYDPRPLPAIIGGLLTFESEWNPPLGQPLTDALAALDGQHRLDIGCVAAHGVFGCGTDGCSQAQVGVRAATRFLLDLISRLQASATVPMIDVGAYAAWLD